MKIDFDQIRELLAVVCQTDISELTIQSGEEVITVKKASAVQNLITGDFRTAGQAFALTPGQTQVQQAGSQSTFEPPGSVPSQPNPQPVQPALSEKNGLITISSPMVGTFYLSPSPSAPSFVKVGDSVAVGQTVCIIEAMKLMNDMPSEVSGRLVKVCVENGTTVEYGQTLFLVDPAG